MRNWLKITIGVLIFSTVCVIVFLSHTADNDKLIENPKVSISYKGEDAILTEKELIYRLKRANLLYKNQKAYELNLESIEKFLKKMPEIKSCDVFKKYGSNWEIQIKLRKLIARAVDKSGNHFYIDDEGFIMKRKPNIVARVPVFTGSIPTINNEGFIHSLINKDSLISNKVLSDIYSFSNYVCESPFFSSLITQIQIDSLGKFELIPQVGDYVIKVGTVRDDADIKDKMFRLENFYLKGIPYEGWEKYKEINLSYDGQIVCRKKQG
jgi:cell division protein FtsQ